MDLNNKKIVLTGGSGFLGKRVKEKLIESGASPSNIFNATKCRGNLDVSGWKFGASTTASQVFRNTDRGSAATPFIK